MTLPRRLYYPIKVAAEKLGCTPEDLIHYGATSQVELCLQLGEESMLCDYSYCDVNKMVSLFTKNNNESDKIYLQCKYNSFTLRISNDDFYVDELFGLVKLNPQDLLSFDLTPFQKISVGPFSLPVGNDTPFDDAIGSLFLEHKEFLDVDLNDVMSRIFITDIEFLNLASDKKPHSNEEPKIPESKHKKSSKTDNAQAKFIKSLLYIHYGEDVAESPRKHLERTKSETGCILADFEKWGIKHVSGVAVDTWLKNIDIDKSGDH